MDSFKQNNYADIDREKMRCEIEHDFVSAGRRDENAFNAGLDTEYLNITQGFISDYNE